MITSTERPLVPKRNPQLEPRKPLGFTNHLFCVDALCPFCHFVKSKLPKETEEDGWNQNVKCKLQPPLGVIPGEHGTLPCVCMVFTVHNPMLISHVPLRAVMLNPAKSGPKTCLPPHLHGLQKCGARFCAWDRLKVNAPTGLIPPSTHGSLHQPPIVPFFCCSGVPACWR